MHISNEELIQYFQDISDTELLRKLRSEDLTEEAQEVARAELRLRNIDSKVDCGEHSTGGESSLRQKRTEISKADSLTRAVPRAVVRNPSRLWWLYFGYLIVMMILGIANYVLRFERSSQLVLEISTVTMLLDAMACIGVWGYLRSTPLGTAWLWAICLAIKILQFAAMPGFAIWARGSLDIPDLCGMALGIPLLIVLWRYAFSSPHIWRSTTMS